MSVIYCNYCDQLSDNAHPILKEKALEVFYWMEQEIEEGSSEDNEFELFVTGLEDLLTEME